MGKILTFPVFKIAIRVQVSTGHLGTHRNAFPLGFRIVEIKPARHIFRSDPGFLHFLGVGIGDPLGLVQREGGSGRIGLGQEGQIPAVFGLGRGGRPGTKEEKQAQDQDACRQKSQNPGSGFAEREHPTDALLGG